MLSDKIRFLAEIQGIDVLGFAEASPFSTYVLSKSKRRNPRLSLPDAKSIIVAGIYIGGMILPKWTDHCYGRTSRLYLSSYFSDIVDPLEPIVNLITTEGYKAVICKGGSNLPLKLAAVRAGLGWQGKHSLLISKKYGTFLALGGIITNAELEYNKREESNYCRECDKCQKACPLSAIDQPYKLNRQKCLSSILQEENLPENAQNVIENRIVDCEICQEICPWNKKHVKNSFVTDRTKSFQKKIDDWENLFYLPDLIKMSEKQYREKLGHLKTGIPFHIFHRNVSIALEKVKNHKG